jgi:hypothetical protein
VASALGGGGFHSGGGGGTISLLWAEAEAKTPW